MAAETSNEEANIRNFTKYQAGLYAELRGGNHFEVGWPIGHWRLPGISRKVRDDAREALQRTEKLVELSILGYCNKVYRIIVHVDQLYVHQRRIVEAGHTVIRMEQLTYGVRKVTT